MQRFDIYNADTHIIEIPLDRLHRRRGCLQGELLAEFLEFTGLSA